MREYIWAARLLMVVGLALAAVSTAQAQTDLALTGSDAPDPVLAGTDITYTFTLTRSGPDAVGFVYMNFAVPAGTTFVSFATTSVQCPNVPPVGHPGPASVTCSFTALPNDLATFTLLANVNSNVAGGTVINAGASAINKGASDPDQTNNQVSLTTTVAGGGSSGPPPSSSGVASSGASTSGPGVSSGGTSLASSTAAGSSSLAGTSGATSAATTSSGVASSGVGSSGLPSSGVASSGQASSAQASSGVASSGVASSGRSSSGVASGTSRPASGGTSAMASGSSASAGRSSSVAGASSTAPGQGGGNTDEGGCDCENNSAAPVGQGALVLLALAGWRLGRRRLARKPR